MSLRISFIPGILTNVYVILIILWSTAQTSNCVFLISVLFQINSILTQILICQIKWAKVLYFH